MKILFNGKFLASQPTGVHRVAEELILAIDGILAEGEDRPDRPDVGILVPRTDVRSVSLSRMAVRKGGYSSGVLKNILWEQFELPLMARGRRLVSLCNISPMFYANSIVMIHDAQVYLTPGSYSKAFRNWYRVNLPIAGRRSRLVLTVSEYSKTQLVEHGVARADKIAVIHNGCDHVLRVQPDEAFLRGSGLDGANYVLALGNTQAHKNIRVLIEAFSREALADTELVLFGGATKADFRKLGMEPGNNVRFLGRVSDGQLAALMGRARAFACPSLTEGFGLPPLEAMALGCPAIIAPCGALPEICGDVALRADPRRPEEWAECIRFLMDNPEGAEDVKRRGIERARAFTWKRAAQQVLDVIRST